MAKKKKKSRYSRTTDVLRSYGFVTNLDFQKVEWIIPTKYLKYDLFGIIDLLLLVTGKITGIQICGADYAPHVKKMTIEKQEYTKRWLKAGGKLLIWSWTQRKKVRGQKALYWHSKITEVYLDGNNIELRPMALSVEGERGAWPFRQGKG